jgi:dimethylhistidine N-methyltransferase
MASATVVPDAFSAPNKVSPAATALYDVVLHEAVSGLRAAPKTLAPWLFYDDRGSQLFEQITTLPEYYVTRTERGILAAHADEILGAAAGSSPLTLLELGSGSSSKTGVLLRALVARQRNVLYQPIDVSASALDDALRSITAEIPGVTVAPLTANYTTDKFTIARQPGERAMALYIGSSIGNFAPAMARSVLVNLREHLQPGDALLLGVDLAPGAHKSVASLLAAYDDAEGITAAFNRNVLVRLNRELGANFNVNAFAHRSRWNAAESRMEMHLESLCAQSVTFEGHNIHFAKGETIHTENSYKFTLDEATEKTSRSVHMLIEDAGFVPEQTWTDAERRFAVLLARVPAVS